MSAISPARRRDRRHGRGRPAQAGPGGRPAWTGPSDRMVLGYPRAWVAAAACATLLVVGGTQYGFGAVAVRLDAAARWGPLAEAWGLAAWAACHAAAGGALCLSRRHRRVDPARTAAFGAACGALGLLFGGAIANPAGAVAVGAVGAGAGTGLVYGTCVTVVAGWFPGSRVPTALAGWAFGAFPFALAAVSGAAAPLTALAWVSLAVTALCAPFLRDAPRGWWPSQAMSPHHMPMKETRRNR